MRFLIDEDLGLAFGKPLRDRGHDVIEVQAEPDLRGSGDTQIAAFAANSDRILVTNNKRDFKKLGERGRPKGGDRVRQLSVVWFCSVDGPRRLDRFLATLHLIVAEHLHQQGHKDRRIVMEIQNLVVRIEFSE